MPVEPQARRPLTRRDRLVIAGVSVAAAAGLAAGIGYAVGSNGSSDSGCVLVTFPASLGGETIRRCGAQAVTYCRAEAAAYPRISDACERAGIRFRRGS